MTSDIPYNCLPHFSWKRHSTGGKLVILDIKIRVTALTTPVTFKFFLCTRHWSIIAIVFTTLFPPDYSAVNLDRELSVAHLRFCKHTRTNPFCSQTANAINLNMNQHQQSTAHTGTGGWLLVTPVLSRMADSPSMGVLLSGRLAKTTSTYSNCILCRESFRPEKTCEGWHQGNGRKLIIYWLYFN